MLDKLLNIQFHFVAAIVNMIITLIIINTNLPDYVDKILIFIQLLILSIMIWMLYKISKY